MRWLPVLAFLALMVAAPVQAQDSRAQAQEARVLAQESRIQALEARLSHLESSSTLGDAIMVLGVSIASGFEVLMIGLFTGFWARSSGRDFWLWFAGGLAFNILALLVLAAQIEEEKKKAIKAAKAAKAAKVPEV